MVKFAYALSALAALIGAANAHSRVYGVWVNDVFQGDGRSTYIRSPPSNSPVKDVSSSDIICNVANTAAPSSVTVAAGDKVTFEWYHDNRADDIIDLSHKGPITVYIAPESSQGAGNVWTKIAESGLSGGKWAVETLVANRGKYDVTLPSALAAGDYLLRAEIIALHEADTDYTVNHARGAQFYPSCSQFKVTGSGTVTPPGTFGFVGGYSPQGPGILFNLYGGPASYPIPGPAVWDGKTGGSAPAASSTAPAATSAPATTAPAPTTTPAATSAPAAPTTSAAPAPVKTSSKPASAAPSATKRANGCSGTVAKYYQCGGKMHTGGTACVSGTTCTFQNDYYSQCL
ncbi:hypothetical protein L873DRAFT_1705648 [Choiromyces venosus 120613-1]|uniref:AA9 family lytic polysaccharide monooxygenase n=1 Tax=Choiromyces venosus 120613-1 TaxID=1336337 RepID=A0A3N4J4W4_9PEZI|nr:hypothetical protein L873DRAFT_1705648 [Choiromyces venosus 120613-1]